MLHPRYRLAANRLTLVVAGALLCAATNALAQSPDPAQAAKLLEQLKSLEETVTKARTGNNMAAVDAITEAATADNKAVALWIDSVRETEYRDKDKKEADFRAWRDGPGKRLADPGAAGALRLHLQYLLLTIKVSNAPTEADRGEIFIPLLGFLDDLSKADKEVLRNRQVLDTSVLESPVAKRFKLDATLHPPPAWSLAPGKLSDIYEKTILPYLRQKKDVARLQTAWSRRISQESAQVSTQNSEFASKTFREIEMPRLEWGQAKDLYVAGSAAAAGKMLQIIQQHQAHKDAPGWIQELRGLLTGEKPEVPATAAGTDSDAGTTPPEPPEATSPAATTPPEAPDTPEVPPSPPGNRPRRPATTFPPNLNR